MGKLTLRQFTDVVKALLEAGLVKKEGFKIKVIEDADKFLEEGTQMTIEVEKEVVKECESKRKNKESYFCDCRSDILSFDMNQKYLDYEKRMDSKKEEETVILKDITEKMLTVIIEEMTEEAETTEESDKETDKKKATTACADNVETDCCCEEDDIEENAEETVLVCKCIMKAALICAAIPIGILVAKHCLCDKK